MPSLGLFLALTLITLLGGKCPPGWATQTTTPMKQLQLIGHWEKTSLTPCGQTYPDRLEFQAGGLYFAHNEPPGRFTEWDVGTYEVAGAQQVKVSTANDAVIAYKASLKADLLTFTAPDGCEFSYRKVK